MDDVPIKDSTPFLLLSERMAYPCFCGKTRTKYIYHSEKWLCHQCWKLQSDNDECYRCQDCPRCVNEIGDKCPQVCAKCAFVAHEALGDTQMSDSEMILNLLNVALDKIG